MAFRKGVYRGRRWMKFHSCADCGMPFEEGDTICKQCVGNGSKIRAYFCKECYQSKFIDL